MNHKYRPAFTLEQLQSIAQSCPDAGVIKIVVPLLSKISMGFTSPAYTPSPENIAKQEAAVQHKRYENDEMSPEEAASYERDILGV